MKDPGFPLDSAHSGIYAAPTPLAAPAEFATWLEILAGAATCWKTRGKMFAVLLDAKTSGSRSLKSLPG